MKPATEPTKPIGELIDRIERIREELFTIQNAMEQMDPPRIHRVSSRRQKDFLNSKGRALAGAQFPPVGIRRKGQPNLRFQNSEVISPL